MNRFYLLNSNIVNYFFPLTITLIGILTGLYFIVLSGYFTVNLAASEFPPNINIAVKNSKLF